MALIASRDASLVPLSVACAALGMSHATHHRQAKRAPTDARTATPRRAPNHRRLSEVERQRILDTLHLPGYADQPGSSRGPAEIRERRQRDGYAVSRPSSMAVG